MLRIIVSVEATCGGCGHVETLQRRDGSPRKLIKAARRALVNRHGWRLAGRSRFSSLDDDLCPECGSSGRAVGRQDETTALEQIGS